MTNRFQASADLTRQFLRATRIVVDNQLSDQAAQRYEAIFKTCVSTLGLERASPLLYVTRTVQSASETITVGDQPVVIYDQNQDRLNDRLSRFVYEEFPTDLVTRAMLRHVRIALFTSGQTAAAAYAGALLHQWPPGGAVSVEPLPKPGDTRTNATLYQECFTLAHEMVHVAMARDLVNPYWREVVESGLSSVLDSPGDLALPLLEAPKRSAIEGFDGVLGAVGEAELARRLDRRVLSRDGTEARYTELRAMAEQQRQLHEEAVCDVVASVITMRFFNPRPTIAVPSLLLALANHITVAMLRTDALLVSRGNAAGGESMRRAVGVFVLRAAVLLHVWRKLVEQHENADALAAMAKYVLILSVRHDFHVRTVAEATLYLIEHGQRTGAYDPESVTLAAARDVRQDILSEMGWREAA